MEAAGSGSDYVFVLDVSGSMANDGKLTMLRNSVERFVAALDDSDNVELITFNISAQALFGSLKPATAEVKTQAEEFLRAQRAVGGTVLRPSIEGAYRYRQADRPLNVVILSDGMTEPQEQAQLIALINQRPAGVTVFCVGVGNEVNRPLLTQLADQAGGLAAFISAGDDFERQAQAFRRKLTRPAGKQVKLTFASGDVYDLEPSVLPNLYYGQPIRLYGRYRQSGPTELKIQAEVLGSPIDQTVTLDLPAKDDTNPQIERMWAAHRVQRLMDDNRASGTTSQVAEIVRLCEGYSIVSEYASFIVLENDAEYKRWQIERRNATRVQRDEAAQVALRQRLEQLRQQTASNLGPASADAVEAKVATVPTAASGNSTANTVAPMPNLAANPPIVNSRGRDIAVPTHGGGGGGGGGAVDPLTVLLGLGLAGLGYANRRRAGE